MTTAGTLNVPGLIRRARRDADLSQRDLADALGVDQSTVARWEGGRGEPGAAVFARILGLADLRIAVLDEEGRSVDPMTEFAPRDAQRRRYPAHLDLEEAVDAMTGRHRITVGLRGRRDERRAQAGVRPTDHPAAEEFASRRRRRREERLRVLSTLLASSRAWTPWPPPACTCPVACEDGPGCVATCDCGCEPARPAPAASLPSEAGGQR